jgi:hypothetical protein
MVHSFQAGRDIIFLDTLIPKARGYYYLNQITECGKVLSRGSCLIIAIGLIIL